MERLVVEIEGVLGKEAVELLDPLRTLAGALLRAGLLDDAYNVMMRAMVLSEKHHGEEGLVTCELRTVMGESRLVSTGKRSFSHRSLIRYHIPPLLFTLIPLPLTSLIVILFTFGHFRKNKLTVT